MWAYLSRKYRSSLTRRLADRASTAIKRAVRGSLIVNSALRMKLPTPALGLSSSKTIQLASKLSASVWLRLDSRLLALGRRLDSILDDSMAFKAIIRSPAILLMLLFLYFASSRAVVSARTLVVLLTSMLAYLVGVIAGRLECSKSKITVAESSAPLYVGGVMYLLGVVFLAKQLTSIGGLPILSEELRRKLVCSLTYVAWSIAPASVIISPWIHSGRSSVDRLKFLAFSSISVAMVALLGYRTSTIAAILGLALYAFYTRLATSLDLLLTFIAVLGAYIGIGVVRYELRGLIDPFYTALSRPTLTVSNFDILMQKYGFAPLSHGFIHISAFTSALPFLPGSKIGPRRIIGSLVGVRGEVSTTATVFAPLILDFGLLGCILASLLCGFVISLLFYSRSESELADRVKYSLYCVLIMYLAPSIESGLLDFNVYVYMGIALMLYFLISQPSQSSTL